MFKTIAAAVLAIAGTQVSAETFTPTGGQRAGGNVLKFIQRVEKLNERGVEVRLDVPTCSSSCTLFLTADDVCVGANSRFKFHGPSANWTGVVTILTGVPMGLITHGMDEAARAKVVERMGKVYDNRWQGLGDWFVKNAAQKFGYDFVTVKGSSLNASFGIPLCEGDKQ